MKKIFGVLLCALFQLSTMLVFADTGPLETKASNSGTLITLPGAWGKAGNTFQSFEDLLQFRAGGHIMGFKPDRVYLVNTAGFLSVEFIGTRGMAPKVSEGKVGGKGQGLQPLGRVEYQNLWEGITLSYEAAGGGVTESTYRLQPGADPGKIRLKYSAEVEVRKDGSLWIKLPSHRGWMTESRPVAWQEIGGNKKPVEVAFKVEGGQIGFGVGIYDRTRELIIDPTYQWHTFYGSAGGSEVGYGMAVDGSGNVYVTGYSYATWDGDGGAAPLHAYSGGFDIFVLKLTSSGAYQWHTFYGSAGAGEFGQGIAVDGSGNVYVTGESDATWNGDGGAAPLHAYSSSSDIFVLKLTSSGAYQWHTFYGSAGGDVGNAIAYDSGNVYVTGESNAIWNGDGGAAPLHAYSGSSDIFVLKFTSSGAYQWHTFYGSAGAGEFGQGIAADGSGNVYVTGVSDATWNGDGEAPPIHAYSGGSDIFVLKLTSSGAYQWHTLYGSAGGYDFGGGIAIDGSGNVYVTGQSYLTWNGDGGVAPIHAYSGNRDIFVLKLTSSGAYQWHTFYGSEGGIDVGYGIGVDGSGNVFVAGQSFATWNGDGGAVPIHAYSGGDDIFVLKLTSNGAYQWHTFYGSAGGPDVGYGIAVDGSGNVYLAGWSSATWNGDEGVAPLHAYSGGGDIFVLRLSALSPTSWGGAVSFSVKITSVETDTSGNRKFVTSNVPFEGTMSLYLGASGLTKSAEGCYLYFLGNDGTAICINDIAAISTESIKSKSEKALFIGSGSFTTTFKGNQSTGMAYIDAKGTLKENSSNDLISIGLSGKIAGGVYPEFVFSGNFNATLVE